MNWAEIADVTELTGKTVTAPQLVQAKATIELHCGAIEAVERPDMTDRDRYWLKLASCYQAAWLVAQPDLFERNDVDSAGQDGESATFKPDAHTLSPLARRALKKLSWRNGRTIQLAYQGGLAARHDVNSEAYDDSLPWRPV